MVGFIYGGNTGLTYQDLQSRREAADALAKRIMGMQPKNVPEGIGALLMGAASGIGRYRADKALGEGRAAASTQFDSILGRILGGGAAGTSDVARPTVTGSMMPKVGDDGSMRVTSSTPPDVSNNGSTFSPFIDTVKAGGLTNPYGLAAVAATGRAESGWSPKKAGGSWADPSESGEQGTSGGVMSWRAERLQNLRNYAASKGEEGNGSPQTQAEFFMKEDPQLIAKLNSAKSPEEAADLMANAWRFAGYNRQGGEAARRRGYASAYLPTFAGQEVASLDPSAGMPPAAAAIERQAPASGYVDPMVSAPNYDPASSLGVPFSPGQKGPDPARVNALTDQMVGTPQASLPQQQPGTALPPLPSQNVSSPPPVASVPPQQVAQAAPPQMPRVQPYRPDPEMLKLLSNPFLDDGQKAALRMVMQQQMQEAAATQEEQTWRARQDYQDAKRRSDPNYQIELDLNRARLEATRNKAGHRNVINVGGGVLYDVDEDKVITPKGETPSGGDAFRFAGTSVEAQALNGLIESGQLTVQQAQSLAAGKTVTGPNGETLFMTPQGIFSQPGAGGSTVKPQTAGPEIDIFADTPMQSGGNMPPSPSSAVPAPAAPAGGNNGTISLTGPKAPNEGQANAGGFADRMRNAESTIAEFENQGTDFWQQLGSRMPGGNYAVSPEFQRYDRARRDFINAQLRRESGAVIGADEFANAEKQYFPQPGDSPAVIEDKRRARQLALQGMTRSAGAGYRPIDGAAPNVQTNAPRTPDEAVGLPPAASPDAGAPPEGVPADLWSVMTPEERALWQR